MSALTVVSGTYGVYLLVTAWLFRWGGVGVGPAVACRRPRAAGRLAQWMTQAGIEDTSPRQLMASIAATGVLGGCVGYSLFGGMPAATASGLFAAAGPLAYYRQRRTRRMAEAQESWPALIEEIRILTGAAGRALPHALLEVGIRGPEPMRSAFHAAQREWALTTDFPRTVALLCDQLASPTADSVCETLLIAHQVGGTDIDRRLEELAEDRRLDNQGRRDARAQQAGVRFARRFVVLVPLGMALAGMSLGDGRAAYHKPVGQALVLAGIGLVAVCWLWSARMLRLPEERRVFA